MPDEVPHVRSREEILIHNAEMIVLTAIDAGAFEAVAGKARELFQLLYTIDTDVDTGCSKPVLKPAQDIDQADFYVYQVCTEYLEERLGFRGDTGAITKSIANDDLPNPFRTRKI